MTILITGIAGFIGFHLAKKLLNSNFQIIGIDNLNDYYDPKLKLARLEMLRQYSNLNFIEADISNIETYSKIKGKDIEIIIHLAAQAGVRYSLENPNLYIESNIAGYVKLLEFAKKLDNLKHLIFASSSSVYGANSAAPFSVNQTIDSPLSLYAATKASGELISYSYSHLYKIPISILRFFTVYGPWGRPDMGMYSFTKAIYDNKPITLYNGGSLKRDFTYISDIIEGIMNVIGFEPKSETPIQTFNLGNSRSEALIDFIKLIELYTGKKAILKFEEAPSTEMLNTHADISLSTKYLNFRPKIRIEEGIRLFIDWYKHYHKIT